MQRQQPRKVALVNQPNMDKTLKPKPDVNIAIFAHVLNEFAQYFIKENKNDI